MFDHFHAISGNANFFGVMKVAFSIPIAEWLGVTIGFQSVGGLGHQRTTQLD